MVLFWAAGAALWLLCQLVRCALFLRMAGRHAIAVGSDRGVAILLSAAVEGLVATGLVGRFIFLPMDFGTSYGTVERRLAILHERAHHSRLDLPANLVATVVLAIHWWNPIAHLAYGRFRSDQELACDAAVVRHLPAADRGHYAAALLKSATGTVPLACPLGHVKELRVRLRFFNRGSPGRLSTAFSCTHSFFISDDVSPLVRNDLFGSRLPIGRRTPKKA